MKLGIVMDPIKGIQVGHDSSLALLQEAQDRGWTLFYFEAKDLLLREGQAYARACPLTVFRDAARWFHVEVPQILALNDLDCILIRKDPPFDQNYLYLTQILDRAEESGVLIVNKPQALRDWNEKLVITAFPECTAKTVVTSQLSLLKEFWKEQGDVVCKPLHAMGGQSVFRLKPQDVNATVIFETLTQQETRPVMVQRFIPEIELGDKRVILIHGEPLPFALARIPKAGEWRGNLAAGATPVAQPLSERDYWLCQQLGPFLRAKGIYLAGIDIIGPYLTEINITSPTCFRELDTLAGINCSKSVFDFLESHLSA